MSDIKNIGFVGLGIMGKPMAKNLIKAEYSVTVHDRVQPAVEEVVAAGASSVESSAAAAAGADVIITMLPDGPDSELVILGDGGVLEGAAPGSVIVDMSSIAPAFSQRIAAACEAKGVDFLDAPVSGGEPMAISGALAIMVGGKQAVFDRVAPMFEPLGASAVLCGDYGAGNTTKLANQIMVAVNIAGVSEALVLSKKAGLDPQKVFDAVKGGLAGSNVLNAKGPMMMAGNFAPGFRIALHQKDLRNALLTATDLAVPLPITAIVQQIVGSLVNDGKGQNDHSAIANFIEDMAGTTIAD
jgi:2-hydroxy-3-oxopropionate reductase